MGRNRADRMILAFGVAALCVTSYFALRYGTVYRIGDSEYHRVMISDKLRVFIPGLALNIALLILAVRQL